MTSLGAGDGSGVTPLYMNSPTFMPAPAPTLAASAQGSTPQQSNDYEMQQGSGGGDDSGYANGTGAGGGDSGSGRCC